MQAEIAQGRLVAVKLHAPDLHRPVGVLHRRRKKFNAATQSFLDSALGGERVRGTGEPARPLGGARDLV